MGIKYLTRICDCGTIDVVKDVTFELLTNIDVYDGGNSHK